ncbi:transcriptional regulator LldR, partial [Pantoea sp. SIMBA_072]
MRSNADPRVTRLRAYITEHQLEPGMRLPAERQ